MGDRVVGLAEELWRRQRALIRDYLRKNFGALPGPGTVFRRVRIGYWVGRMRQRYWAGQLPARAVGDMEAVPGWSWGNPPRRLPLRATDWENNFRLLREFVDEHGRIPSQRTEYRRVQIGYWVDRQRVAMKARLTAMTAERRAALESVPGWTWGDLRADNELVWWDKFERLRRYTEAKGRLPLVTAVVDGVNLGSWIRLQRRANKGLNRCVMTLERRAALNSLPKWRW
ncbi:MAG: helicase associated domain-containing protein [Gemmatimonadaceae bacterium]